MLAGLKRPQIDHQPVRRVGDNESFQVDVRIVCATHRDLDEMVRAGDFREDLMFRINTIEIPLPSLRERIEDIPQLAGHLLQRFARGPLPEDGRFTPEAIETLQEHHWPGNVRELANVIEHATILCDELPIDAEHLPKRFGTRGLSVKSFGPNTLRAIEIQAIQQALDRHNGSKPKAAEELGVSLKTLYNKLNQLSALERTA